MFTETTSLGLNVHACSVSAAAIDGSPGELIHQRLSNDLVEIGEFVEELAHAHTYPLRSEEPVKRLELAHILRAAGERGLQFA